MCTLQKGQEDNDPLRPPTVKEGSHEIVMISIELAADHESVLAKVLSFLEKIRLDL